MNKIYTILFAVLITSNLILSQVPKTISYQGYLTDASQNPISGDQPLTMAIYDVETGGTAVWQEVQVVPVVDGIFNVIIGSSVPLNLAFDDQYWLGIKVGAQSELEPRIKLTASPYSLNAQSVVDSSITTPKIADGAITQDKLAPGLSLPPGGIAGGDLTGNYPNPMIDSNSVTEYKIAPNQVVKSINSLKDDVIMRAEGGATISTNGDTLIINAGSGGGSSGVQAIQNVDNTLQISNPNGPTTTIDIKAGGITSSKIADSSITQNKIAAGVAIPPSGAAGGDLSGNYPSPSVVGIQGRAVAGTAPTNGQILKWNGSQWLPSSDDAGTSVWGLNGLAAYYNSGDVGIGTTTPSAKQEIFHNSSLSDPHVLLHENGNDYARINFDNNNGSNYWTIAGYIASNPINDRLNFWNGNSGDIITITGDARFGLNVGISPKAKFHVGEANKVLFGADTIGSGDKLMWLPEKHAFRVGTVSTGVASTYWNPDSIGLYSFASGLNTRAQGFGATAMGRDTEAENSYAFASGYFSNANGQYSTAMGFNTDAFGLGSTALGYSTDAEQNYTFAAGYFAEAQAIYSIALGNAVQAQSYSSMAVGRYNVGGGSATSWVSSDPIFEIGIGTGPSTRENAITVRKDGNVGIGTTFPGAPLHVIGALRIGSLEEITDGGSFLMSFNSTLVPEANGTRNLGNSTFRWATVYATNGTINTSDEREKNNIQDIRYGLNEIMQLRPVAFTWKDMPETGTKLGLIAQDVKKVISEVVSDKDWIVDEETGNKTEVEAERMGIYYADMIPVLIKAIQEQQKEIEELKARIGN